MERALAEEVRPTRSRRRRRPYAVRAATLAATVETSTPRSRMESRIEGEIARRYEWIMLSRFPIHSAIITTGTMIVMNG